MAFEMSLRLLSQAVNGLLILYLGFSLPPILFFFIHEKNVPFSVFSDLCADLVVVCAVETTATALARQKVYDSLVFHADVSTNRNVMKTLSRGRYGGSGGRLN